MFPGLQEHSTAMGVAFYCPVNTEVYYYYCNVNNRSLPNLYKMAAPMDQSIEEIIKETVKSTLKHTGFIVNNVPLTKRSNDFDQGDFCVPSGCVKQFQEPVKRFVI